MLEIRNLHKRFGNVRSVDGVSLLLQPGCIYALVGPNGCGKSTLLNLISGFYRPDRGQILMGREQIHNLPPAARARKGISRMFQEPRATPNATVLRHLTFGMLGPGSDNLLVDGLRRLPPNEPASLAEALLDLGGLKHAARRHVAELSFGERRILDFLCLMGRGAAVLLLDEPFTGVDPANLRTLVALVTTQVRQTNSLLLLVSHEIPTVVSTADDIILMEGGSVILRGKPADVCASETFRKVYVA